jgi:type VII secretion-associated serine protease mycosin
VTRSIAGPRIRPHAGARTRVGAVVLALGALTITGAPAAQAAPGPTALRVPAALPAATSGGQCDQDVPALVTDTPPALPRLAAEQAWQQATGAGVLVAVVDSGVDAGNAHLTEAVVPGVDLVGQAGDATGRTDTAGHGTAVAGQIAARTVPDSGVVGLAPDATVLPVRVYYGDDDQARTAGTAPDATRIAAGIDAAVAAGARIVNVSMSTPVDTPELRDAVRRAVEAGSLVVASAGNRNTSSDETDGPRYPAAYEGVLGVAAVDVDDQPTQDSIHGAHVDVVAPGTNILTAFHAAGDCMLSGEEASTSFATAYVSAAAALLAERYPQESPAQWAYRLEVTAARAQPAERDDLVGWGIVRPDQALSFVDDGTAAGPPSPVHGRTAAVVAEPRVVDLTTGEDPLAEARARVVWPAIGATTVVLLSVLASRAVPRRRRARAARAARPTQR